MYSALPPSPAQRYPQGVPVAIADAQNSLSRPKDPELDLSLGEGTYQLSDQIQLGTIPLHPTEVPQQATHVLDPRPVPITSGVKLSLAVIALRKTSPRIRTLPTAGSARSSSSSNAIGTGTPGTTLSGSDSGAAGHTGSSNNPLSLRWRFGENQAFNGTAKEPKDPAKRRKPGKGIIKSNSSFISRVIQQEQVLKTLGQRDPAGLFVFLNTSRAFQWLDLASAERMHEPLVKILFTKAHALCHDVNQHTKHTNHLDVIIGSNQGDIIWYEPFSGKYTRLNKNANNAIINPNPIIDIKWLPNSDNLFIAAFSDGMLILFDTCRDDSDFKPEPQLLTEQQKKRKPRLAVRKSAQSKFQSHNPVAAYKVSREPVNQIAFSPSGRTLATVSEDGTLRIIDMTTETLVDLHQSYYGGINCVTWSPDGEFILTGGQDDIVSLYSLSQRCVVFRGRGHKSWITAVAFDPWRCDDDGNYRFASVGEDTRLLLWDFGTSMLSRQLAASIRGASVSSSAAPSRAESVTTLQHVTADAAGLWPVAGDGEDEEIAHPAPSRNAVPTLPPIMSKQVDQTPLTWVGFEADGILVASRAGRIKTYRRPDAEVVQEDGA